MSDHSKPLLTYFLSLLLFLSSTFCFAQTIDSLSGQLSRYGQKTGKPVLFVHFDKTIYSNGENIWFTAYLLKAADIDRYKLVAVVCVKDDDHSIAFEDKFVMKNGLASGNMLIPDSIPPGNYSLMAYTNRLVNGLPDVTFAQPITIKSADAQTFKAVLNPVDTALNLPQQKVMLMVNNSGIDALPNVPVSYYVGNTTHHVMAGKVRTDKAGQYIFTIPSKLLTTGSNRLYVEIRYNKEIKQVAMELPVKKELAQVRFYPEGGNLVNGSQNTVGFEVKTATGNPLRITAFLYQDNKIISTIQTSSYGMGSFTIMPQPGSSYYIKLNNIVQKDTIYKLPTVIQSGPAISVKQAIANDTLDVELHDNNQEKVYLLVHNYKQLFFTVPVMMNSTSKRVKILLADIPKGLTQLTLADSLGRPFAERVFFAHYNRRTPVQITTDQAEYGTRKKVTIKVKLNITTADTGLISIACVQANRMEIKKQQDIESYVYLKNDLGDLPLKDDYMGDDDIDKKYLEDILLIKGWARYKWTDVLKTRATDSLPSYQGSVFNGTVTLFDKPLKKPVELTLMNQRDVRLVSTDKNGNFSLNEDQLISAPNKMLILMANGDKPDGYRIHIKDPYLKTDTVLNRIIKPREYIVPKQQSTQYTLVGDKLAIHLKQVIISKKFDNFYLKRYGYNECGDYVCRYGILNCPNHPFELDNKPPVIGEIYNIRITPYESVQKEYFGCGLYYKNENVTQFKGIYSAQEFYGEDYSKQSLPQPEYQSTIYWKNLSVITSSAEKEFSFYTSDITGKFKIVVQGITGNNVFYGGQTFNVVKSASK